MNFRTKALRVAAVVAASAIVMLTATSYRRRSIMRGFSSRVEAIDRYIDIGVVLKVVRADPKGEQLIPGARKMRVLREYHLGGIVDTQAEPPRLLDPDVDGDLAISQKPQEWLCSEDQEKVVLHRDADTPGNLAIGGMGAGKTTSGVIWIYLRWLEHLGQRCEGGITAPTEVRLSLVFNEIFRMFPAAWFNYQTSTGIMTMCDGLRVRGVSTHQQSASQGSRVQGFNWRFWLGDEVQDQISQFVHIQARLRAKLDGRAKRLGTATAKDSSDWRDLKDTLAASGMWTTHLLLGPNSPFIHPDHWAAMKKMTSEREYKRLVLAEDGPPELAVYYGWLRQRNLVALPQIATDVTPALLTGYQSYTRPGARFTLIAAHDPGSIYNTTVILKLLMFGDVPTWTVVGELQTSQTTAREHAVALGKYLRESFFVDFLPTRHNPDPGPKCLVFCDPHGKGEAQTDYQSVYMAFQKEGLDVFSPAAMTGRIKRSARIEMMNRLLGGTAENPGAARLVVATDHQHRPVAPKLVDSFESLKKQPGNDDPEGRQKKDEHDKTHAPTACAYGLWMFEQEAFTERTVQLARAEARRFS